MSKKIERVLLIDDNEADNFFHRLCIERSGLASAVDCCESVEGAIRYLDERRDNRELMPTLIFVDINMPEADGWEFLRRYDEHVTPEKRTSTIFILSTSVNPADRERAEAHPLVRAYVSKPLDIEAIRQLSASLL